MSLGFFYLFLYTPVFIVRMYTCCRQQDWVYRAGLVAHVSPRRRVDGVRYRASQRSEKKYEQVLLASTVMTY